MPDSLPPQTWGPAPFDERDLDAVLSGETADIPVALRPVADTLTALRAAGAPAELSGEATIMAEFRALAGSRGLGLGDTARLADPAPTPQLSVVPADRPRGRAARHRGRRRAAPPVARRAGALMGAAAAVLIVVAVVYGGNLPGPIQSLAHLGRTSAASASAAHPGSNSASPGLQATGAATVPANPATSHAAAPESQQSSSSSAADPRSLCREYYGYFTQQSPVSWKAELSLFRKLSKLAGGPFRVFDYCSPYLGDLFSNGIPRPDKRYPPGMYPGDSGQGSQPQLGVPAQQGQGSTPGPGGASSGTYP